MFVEGVVVRRLALLFATALLAGCAGSSGSQTSMASTRTQSVVPPINAVVQVQSRAASPVDTKAAVPATCNHSKAIRFRIHGGLFHMPPCAQWTGSIAYPGSGITTRWKLTTSAKDNFGVPSPPSGTAIFYMQMKLKERIADLFLGYGDGTATVTSPALTSDHSYTLMVYGFYYDNQCNELPCPPWVANIGSPEPGEHSITFDSPLNDGTASVGYPLVWQFIEN
jgi:hypothetical protein